MPRAHKVDEMQARIVAALRAAHCSVAVTSMLGDGFPDLLVGRNIPHRGGVTFLLEVKTRTRGPSGAIHEEPLTPVQMAFRAAWRGHYAIVHNIDEAMIAVGVAE